MPAASINPRQYAFIEAGGLIHALLVPAGQSGVSCGGVILPARAPATADERHAIRRLERDIARAAERPQIRQLTDRDTVAIMARAIADRARQCGNVERRDFHQAGIPDCEIDAHLNAAFARARRLEPRLDGMREAA